MANTFCCGLTEPCMSSYGAVPIQPNHQKQVHQASCYVGYLGSHLGKWTHLAGCYGVTLWDKLAFDRSSMRASLFSVRMCPLESLLEAVMPSRQGVWKTDSILFSALPQRF